MRLWNAFLHRLDVTDEVQAVVAIADWCSWALVPGFGLHGICPRDSVMEPRSDCRGLRLARALDGKSEMPAESQDAQNAFDWSAKVEVGFEVKSGCHASTVLGLSLL